MTDNTKHDELSLDAYTSLKRWFEVHMPGWNTCVRARYCQCPCPISLAYVTFRIGPSEDIDPEVRWLRELIAYARSKSIEVRTPLSHEVGPVIGPLVESKLEKSTAYECKVNLQFSLRAGHHVSLGDTRIYRGAATIKHGFLESPEVFFDRLTARVFLHRACWPGVGELRIERKAQQISESKCYLESLDRGGGCLSDSGMIV